MIAAVTPALARDYNYEVGPFDRLSVRGNFNIVYRCNPDSSGFARYESDKDVSAAIDITTSKGKLSIKEVNDAYHSRPLPTIYVYSDFITQIESEENATVTAHLSMATPKLSLKMMGNGKISATGVRSTNVNASIQTGNGTIAIEGKCTTADFKMTGTGVIQADALEADNVKCSVLGTGTIGCWANDLLDVRGIGTTKIYYKGDPRIKKIGGAKIAPLPGSEAGDDAREDAETEQAED